MHKFAVELGLQEVARAKKEFREAEVRFRSDVDYVLTRLLWEAATNRMSDVEVAKHAGMTRRQIREMMRRIGMDPKKGKTLLAKQAATALAENAALLGIEPHEMDLTSPLAYLPMGSELRKILELEDDTVSGNRECWCGGDVGERTPGDEDGLGCLEDINHDWRDVIPSVREDDVVVHGINFFDDEIGCGAVVGYAEPVMMTLDIEKITCGPCRKVLIRS